MFSKEHLSLPEGFDLKDPINIRGHHLNNYFGLYKKYIESKPKLQILPTRDIAREVSFAVSDTVLTPLPGYNPATRSEYLTDILGPDSESEKLFREELVSIN